MSDKLVKFLVSSRITDGVLKDQIHRKLYKPAIESCNYAIIITELKLQKLNELKAILTNEETLTEFLTEE